MQQRLATALLGVLLGMPHLVLAQGKANLESVASHVKAGEQFSVITTDGERLRARFDRATASDLTVSVRDKTVVLPASKVARVIKHDSSWNGAGYGALAGAVIGGFIGANKEDVRFEYGDAAWAVGALGYGLLGLGVGFATDASLERVVYHSGAQVTVRPHVSSFTPPGATKAGMRAGLRATIAW